MEIFAWWGLFFALCLLLELSSPGYFFFLSFSIGSLAAGVAAWYDVAPMVQGGIFLGISALTFALLRRYVKRIEQKGAIKTNVDALHGKKCVVTEDISPLSRGWVLVDGEPWAALPYDDTPIKKGAVVKVIGSAGTHLTVKKLENNA